MMLNYSTVFIARETNVIRNCEFLGSFLLEKDNQTTEVGCSAFFLYITLSVGELFFIVTEKLQSNFHEFWDMTSVMNA